MSTENKSIILSVRLTPAQFELLQEVQKLTPGQPALSFIAAIGIVRYANEQIIDLKK